MDDDLITVLHDHLETIIAPDHVYITLTANKYPVEPAHFISINESGGCKDIMIIIITDGIISVGGAITDWKKMTMPIDMFSLADMNDMKRFYRLIYDKIIKPYEDIFDESFEHWSERVNIPL